MTEPRDTTPYTETREANTAGGKPFPPFTDPGQEQPHPTTTPPAGNPVPPFTDPGQAPNPERHDREGGGGNLSDIGEATPDTDTGPDPEPDRAASERAARNAAEEEADPPDTGMDAVIDEIDQRTSGLVGKLKNKLPGHDSKH